MLELTMLMFCCSALLGVSRVACGAPPVLVGPQVCLCTETHKVDKLNKIKICWYQLGLKLM